MRAIRTLGAAALVAGLVACGSGEPAPQTSPTTTAAKAAEGPDLLAVTFEDATGQEAVAIQARDNSYLPEYVEIDAGTTVTFTNKGRNQHNVYPTVEGSFATIDTDDFEPGESAEVTFTEPGDYPYYCTLHGTKRKGMVGAIRVVGS